MSDPIIPISKVPVFDLPALQHNEEGNPKFSIFLLEIFFFFEYVKINILDVNVIFLHICNQFLFNIIGWGPCELPDAFRDMPYQPFSKSDRLGKISDWTGTTQTDKKYSSKFNK